MKNEELIDAALRSLDHPRWTIEAAVREVASVPGLYAVHGEAKVWRELGLGDPPDDRPLYVGKAERSLASRDVRTHFATGKTGSSTLRRTLAALLADNLTLRGQPRNPSNPEGFANFGLEPEGDARLTDWMHRNLLLAVWPSSDDVVLDQVETAVLTRLVPPLNLDKVRSPWQTPIEAGRRRLAAEAREWASEISGAAEPGPVTLSGASGRVLGVDAAGKHGWVGVVLQEGNFGGARLGSLRGLIDWAEPVDVIGVDIPIGHAGSGSRKADDEARRFVGPRASSVFPAPPAEALRAASYADANRVLQAAGLPMLSRQAWALVPKVLEAAEFGVDPRLYEVHPEVSFCHMAGECLTWSKKSWNGILRRRRLLSSAGIEIPEEIPEVGSVVADDLVDAAVVAWSANRIAAGKAHSLPDPPEVAADRLVAIWC